MSSSSSSSPSSSGQPSASELVESLRVSFESERTRSLAWRRKQLLGLHRLVVAEEARLAEAVHRDVRKNLSESVLSEFSLIVAGCTQAITELESWAKPERVSTDIAFKLDSTATIRRDPLGVVLIIGAWNYPVQLTLVPLIGAIAAGNCAVLKPSEISPHTSAVLAELIPRYLDPDAFAVYQGGVPETTALLRERFDHIVYTGNAHVARIVMAAAAKHLTPVTLELGGKSPCYVGEDVKSLRNAARRIAWGRFSNAGQTCVAPDYVLCHPAARDELVRELAAAVRDFYGEDPQQSQDYGRIVNARHFKRVSDLLSGQKVAVGGQRDEADLYIAPTVVTDADPSSPLMQEEIFGPVLPVLTVGSTDEAIRFINAREKPLALYVFTNKTKTWESVLSRTSSGGAVVNDTLVHCGVDTLPFGGVGESGMGAYHGRSSFELFSHHKSTLVRSYGMEFVNDVRYAPYKDWKLKATKFLFYTAPPTTTQVVVRTAIKIAAVAGIAALAWRYFG